MRVLVLGGTGAMGEPLVKLLAERGDEVYVTSRRKRQDKGSVHYIQGDAHDLSFIRQELGKNYDAIVDFMIYSTNSFRDRSKLYLQSTGQYMFLSSARVYAESKEPITEKFPRLLDVCKDEDYLKTDEYALAKARSENVLFESDHKNWTIVRPYITYNTKRLQLGGLELGTWLTATLFGRPLVLPKDVGIHQTTMTHGDDVARAMAALIGNSKARGEAFHITGNDHINWREVAEIYKNVLEKHTGHSVEIYEPETSKTLSAIMGNATQIKYDRTYDRVFDNSKLLTTCGDGVRFISMTEGLNRCLYDYLSLPDKQKLVNHNVMYEAWLDKSTGRAATFDGVESAKGKLKYMGYYHAPGVMQMLKKIKHMIRQNHVI